jgi:hypothetical protein
MNPREIENHTDIGEERMTAIAGEEKDRRCKLELCNVYFDEQRGKRSLDLLKR